MRTVPLARCLLKWAICNILSWIGILRLLEWRTASTLRILVFHRVSATRVDDGMTVSRAIFDNELHYLTAKHHIVSLDEVAAMLQGKCPFVRGAVAITFDDGYRDMFSLALPILTRYKTPATIFLAVGAIDGDIPLWTEDLRQAIWATCQGAVDLQPMGWEMWPLRTEMDKLACLAVVKGRLKAMPDDERQRAMEAILHALQGKGLSGTAEKRLADEMLSWSMVREMRKRGVTMGAHTVSHKILPKVSPAEAEWEIMASKQRIEEQLGEPVQHFAYPNGTRSDWDLQIQTMVQRAGFETACTTLRGGNPVGQDIYALRRIEVNDPGCTNPWGRFSPAMFAAQLVGLFGGWEH